MKVSLASLLRLAISAAIWLACLEMPGVFASGFARAQGVVGQPPPPTSGPGSPQYSHAALSLTTHGEGPRQFWIFSPDDPQPTRAPVVVFLHGWSATNPSLYGAWIKHLVRRGNVVIYPRYQDGLGVRPGEFVSNAVAAIRQACELMALEHAIQMDLERVAFIGHSMGAVMAANMAQDIERLQLPVPRALFLAEPAFEPLLNDYQQIARDTLILVTVGADVKRDATAQRILMNSTQVPATNKNFVALPSDSHGTPPLVSDHFAPCAFEPLAERFTSFKINDWGDRSRNALDYYGYWKLCDGLLDAAFFGRNRQYALEDSPELRFMGHWSDGTPVREAMILAIPSSPAISRGPAR